MGALGEIENLVESFRSKNKADAEQTRVLNFYDRNAVNLGKELEDLEVLSKSKKKYEFDESDYRKVYDALNKFAERPLADFKVLSDSFEHGETKTNVTEEELYQWGRDLSDFAPRVPGTFSMDKTNDYLIKKLNSFGIETWTEPINFNGVFFHKWKFEITSPEKKEYVSFPENNVGFGDINAELIYLGKGLEEDYENVDVKGKIILVNLGAIDEHEGPCAERRRYTILHIYDLAYAHGVAGIVGYFSDTPGNALRLLEPGIKPIGGSNIWGPAEVGPDHQFTIPVLNIGRECAEEIIETIAKGKTEAHVLIEGVRKVSTTNIVLGLLPGYGEKAIAVGSHTCTAFEGAVCDTIGVVAELGIAKHFASLPLEKREKSILFFFDSFHVWGNCCQTAITVNDRYKTLSDKVDAFVWLDHIGDGTYETVHATSVSDNPVVWPLTALTQLKYGIAPYVSPVSEIWTICATGAYQRRGVPTVTNQAMNNYLLTPEDTWDKFLPEVVYRDVFTHVDLIDGLLKLDIPQDTPVEPFGGCGSLFTDLSQPEYKNGESYVPEPDYPLYIGGEVGVARIKE